MAKKLALLLLVSMTIQWLAWPIQVGRGRVFQSINALNTYYVSSSQGNDNNNGLSINTPFATVNKVNSLLLQPGEQVSFKCGDVWRADPLIITRSGSAGQPIAFGSYPAGCQDKPVFSGAQPVAGWTHYSGAIYTADLSAGANAGKFFNGVNQLFRNGTRLVLGRWPNLDAGDGGYSTIDGQPAANKLTDNQLPAVSWTGAVAHIRGMRWYILNRLVTGTAGPTITLGSNLDCWAGSCTGWGYFLNNNLNTLDQDGEWYYDAPTHRVYLYSVSGAPAGGQIEGSVILYNDDRSWGGIVLGKDLGDEIAYVSVENLELRGWFRHGIATPTNLHGFENHDLTMSNNTIADVDGTGINLATWVYEAQDGPDGWRGGHNLTLSGNLIRGANHMGINSYAKGSSITGNTIRDVGLIGNLGASGMGCSYSASGGVCTEDGDGIRIKVDQPLETANNNTVSGNRLERIAYNGMDIFGYQNTIDHNVIRQACYAKGDCGGVRTFGSDNLSATAVHDLVFTENMILDTIGNTDGCQASYRPLFGFGLYIDNYSRNITITGNTIISSTVSGILYQNSTGSISGNTLYNNSQGTMYAAQVNLTGPPTSISNQSNNILYSLNQHAWTLAAADKGRLSASDYNYFFNPYLTDHISVAGAKSLAEWQAYSGMDAHSKETWFHLNPGDPPRSRIFYNDTPFAKTFDLGTTLYVDLDQIVVAGSLSLQPYHSKVLVTAGEVADLVLTMSVIGSPDTIPGAPITYTLAVLNQGLATASQIVLTQIVPEEIIQTAWQASSGGVTAQPGTRYVWNLPDLTGGASVTITVTGTFTDTLTPGLALPLAGQVTTSSPEATTANNQALLKLGIWRTVFLPAIVDNH